METEQKKPRKQRNKGFLAGAIVCIFFGVFSLCGAIFSVSTFIDINDTEEFGGTVNNVEKIEQDTLISLNEYAFKLLIDPETVVDDRAISNLNEGEKSFFFCM